MEGGVSNESQTANALDYKIYHCKRYAHFLGVSLAHNEDTYGSKVTVKPSDSVSIRLRDKDPFLGCVLTRLEGLSIRSPWC